jgi:hypothetical protein
MRHHSQITPDTTHLPQAAGSQVPQPFLGFESYVDAEEAAQFLKVTARRVKDMARAGAIPAHPFDPGAERKDWRFLLSELSVWMRNNSGKKRKS